MGIMFLKVVQIKEVANQLISAIGLETKTKMLDLVKDNRRITLK
jgi:hypothetical protein